MKRKTTEQFISEAKQVHGEKFSYEYVKYCSRDQPVKIVCPIHGTFEQTPNTHLHGGGCQKCKATKLRKTHALPFEVFKNKAHELHGDRYRYFRDGYTRAGAKTKILCSIHGVFLQRASYHLLGRGCPKCGYLNMASQQRLKQEEFIFKAQQIHGAKYGYEDTKYFNNSKKLKIICREHGEFYQTPNNHLKGIGCPSCAEYGFDENKPSYLYILKAVSKNLIKIGITNYPEQRFRQLRRATPFDFEVLEIVEAPGTVVRETETRIKRTAAAAGLRGFDGATEWLLK